MRSVIAWIAIGSNLGDRSTVIRRAVDDLLGRPGIGLLALSALVETDPVGPPGQGPYLNGAIGVVTTLAPEALLATLLAVEHGLGRTRSDEVRWGPRTIDLDLLLYGDAVIDEPGLHVPHPRLHERRFVLEPLAMIAAEVRHPVIGRTVRELLAACPAASGSGTG